MLRNVSCILLTIFCMSCCNYGSASTQYSIGEILEQARSIKNWSGQYEALGRTIDVNVPIVIPEINAVPILEIEIQEAFSEERIIKDPDIFIDDKNRIIDSRIPREVGGDYSGAICTISRYIKDKYIHIKYNAPSLLLSIKPNDYLKCEEVYYYYDELKGDAVYPENSDLSLEDAIDILSSVVSYAFPENNGGIFIDNVRIIGRGRKTKSYSSEKLGEYVEYYPTGSYGFSFYNTVNNIPILIKSSEMYETLLKYGIKADAFGPLSYIKNTAQIVNHQSMEIMMFSPQIKNVLYEDIPLASIDLVLENAVQEIKNGHIRNVYSMRFGYGCYLNEKSPNTYTLFPVWMIECDYVKSSKAEIKQNKSSKSFRDGFNFTELVFNAQTGEVVNWAKPTQNDLYCPSIMTW